ncbi:MAG: LysM peptidoglycan-binding domain-containing protein [Chloroflexi bacterium]|nr:MAG: LysM peptidoglycan-binding domain-containing protein [Chloroflexota bacterium]
MSGMRICRILLAVILLVVALSIPAEAGAGNLSSTTAARRGVDTDPYSLVNQVNALRTANGLAPYTANPILMSVAQAHANHMAATGSVSHTGAGGTTSSQRIQAAGYPLAGDLSLGGMKSENIMAGSNLSVQEAVQAWQGDAPHLNTMLSANLQEIGAGVAIVGDYVYYVIDCARPTASGIPQSYTPAPGTTQVSGDADAAPLASTIIPSTPNAEGKLVHTVRPGETLWLIAITYGVKIAEIRRLNNMAEADAIYPGEKLLVKKDMTPAPSASLTPPAQVTAPLALMEAPAATLPPILLPSPSLELPSQPLPTPTLAPVAAVSADSNKLVLAVIVAAALVLAAIFVRASRRQ